MAVFRRRECWEELAGEREIQNQLRLEEPRKQRSDLNLEFEKEDCSNLRES